MPSYSDIEFHFSKFPEEKQPFKERLIEAIGKSRKEYWRKEQNGWEMRLDVKHMIHMHKKEGDNLVPYEIDDTNEGLSSNLANSYGETQKDKFAIVLKEVLCEWGIASRPGEYNENSINPTGMTVYTDSLKQGIILRVNNDAAKKTIEEHMTKSRTWMEPQANKVEQLLQSRIIKTPLTKGQAEFFQKFYSEVEDIYTKNEGNDVIKEVTITIPITGVNKAEYTNFFKNLLEARDKMNLFPARGHKEDVMNFERDVRAKNVTITFKNIKRELMKPDFEFGKTVIVGMASEPQLAR